MLYAVVIGFVFLSNHAVGIVASEQHFASKEECEVYRAHIVEQFREQMDMLYRDNWKETENHCGYRFEIRGGVDI